MVASQPGRHASKRTRGLQGSVPDQSGTALLLIDVVNDFEFEGGERLLPTRFAGGQGNR